MLACLQRPNQPARHQHQPTRPLTCATHILDTLSHKSEPNPTHSLRHPSVAELNAYAQKTLDAPLSIKIFPSNIRVPTHKHVSRTVNGLDTRLGSGPHPYARGYQGLLAIAKTKGVFDVKRAKMAVAPRNRHRQNPYVHPSPSFAESSFAYSGAVLPTQSAGVTGLGSDYWENRGIPHGSRSSDLCYRSQLASPSFGQFFATAWNGDCISTGPSLIDPGLVPYPADPSRSRASLLSTSTSLRSLESLISEIHPPCIKESMLGHGYGGNHQPVFR
ncbi:protein FAM222A [Rhinichthys klamathensis goyatoka]|uniref:protein FAM222A n=1 Tax=Rhinichthys klamathensis goyatoka TaxID=3034132 RepID=UPI0024B494A6|nr:protein FAM222A [Rhinichthys klamathensis goyatoka]XP_056096731.1 protein FAM222A [Rhinichthys klamathensis goyatoka]XP_056096732.1 protein FAM222A [Rhinichthys klamathensis goyatoka]